MNFINKLTKKKGSTQFTIVGFCKNYTEINIIKIPLNAALLELFRNTTINLVSLYRRHHSLIMLFSEELGSKNDEVLGKPIE